MRRFFHSISFRFWAPFALMAILIISIASYYLPSQQQKVFFERKRQALLETAQGLALGIELSLDAEDFSGIKRSIDFVKKHSDIKFIGIILKDSATRSEELLGAYPEGNSYAQIAKIDTGKYLFQDFPFQTTLGKGYVRIAESKQELQEQVNQINRPVYISLLGAIPFFLLILYIISRTLAGPILRLTRQIKEAENDLKNHTIPLTSKKSEIAVLQNTFSSLVTTLQQKNNENEALISNQELLVKARTLELELAQKKLILSQKRAKIGHYEVLLPSGLWESSQTLDDLLGIEKGYKKDREGMERLIMPDFQKEVLSFFYPDNHSLSIDCEIQLFHMKKQRPVWARLIGEKQFSKEGTVISVTGIIQDIHEQKKDKEEIQRLSLVAEYTSNSVIITDKNKKILWVNNSLLKLTGYDPEEIIGKTPSMFQFEKTDRNTIAYINSKLQKKETISKVEILNRGKKGNEYWLELNIVPLFDSEKQVTGYIAVENDITLRKQYEEGLRSINKDLEQKVQENALANIRLSRAVNEYEKMAAIGEMAAGVAHDLNTPISTIMVGAETMQYVIEELFKNEITKLNEEEWNTILGVAKRVRVESFVTGTQLLKEKREVETYLNAVLKNRSEAELQKLADLFVKCRILPDQEKELLHQLLGFEKVIQMLKAIENLQTINTIVGTIQSSVSKSTSVIKNLRSYIRDEEENSSKKIVLLDNISSVLSIFNYDIIDNNIVSLIIPKELTITGNEIKLFQLWSNLIKNAMEAMREQENKQLIIKGEKTDDKIVVSFENNGPVIPAEDLGKIFKIFYSTKEKQGGSGLGLSIVRRIVQEHFGTLEVTSVPGKTCFSMSFPASRES